MRICTTSAETSDEGRKPPVSMSLLIHVLSGRFCGAEPVYDCGQAGVLGADRFIEGLTAV